MSTTLLLIRHGQTPWNTLGKIQGCTNIDLEDAIRAYNLGLIALECVPRT